MMFKVKISANPADHPMRTNREFHDAIAAERKRCVKRMRDLVEGMRARRPSAIQEECGDPAYNRGCLAGIYSACDEVAALADFIECGPMREIGAGGGGGGTPFVLLRCQHGHRWRAYDDGSVKQET